jgi:hypothetical protein
MKSYVAPHPWSQDGGAGACDWDLTDEEFAELDMLKI